MAIKPKFGKNSVFSFLPNFCFFAVTFEPQTLDGQSRALKTDSYFTLVSTGNLRQKAPIAVGAQGPMTSGENA